MKYHKIYKSMFMESYVKDLWTSLKSISKLLKQFKISFTFIGGAARNQYGYQKITEDIDILIARKDKEKMKNLPIGFIKDIGNKKGKRFLLHDPKTNIDIIYEDEISGDGVNGIKFLNPDRITNIIKSEPFISLKALIMYKLSSGIYGNARYKDFDDIIELIKRNNLSINYANKFREDLKNKYIELWNQTKNN